MSFADDDEWAVASLDLDGYLDRVGVSTSLSPDVDTLTRLHRAHVDAIPFENLDIMLGREVHVDLEHVQTKLVRERRGGYCYEHAVLFAAVLTRLGFRVRRQLGRMGADPARPSTRTHMTVLVDVEGRRWLADTGFGWDRLAPLALEAGPAVRQGEQTYRLVRPDPRRWTLERRVDAAWVAIYTLDEQTVHQSDVVVSNHFTATWPASPFVQRLMVIRKDEDTQRRLVGRELRTTRPGAVVETETVTDLGRALRGLGLDLPANDVAVLDTWLDG